MSHKTAYVFPGQGAQFEGMGRDLYESGSLAREMFAQADEILGFSLSQVMLEGTAEALKQTNVTQPAIYVHSMIKSRLASDSFQPDAVAGHSLGEFSALAASGGLTFEDGLNLVRQRAEAMQKACEAQESTMAAVLGLDDDVVERTCAAIDGIVVPANYNCPGQLVISGTTSAIDTAVARLQEAGARRVIVLAVGGAFHSPLMEPAREELSRAIQSTHFEQPRCPIYQNVNGRPSRDAHVIQKQLIEQLTAPVRWTQTITNMLADGFAQFIEVGGTGKVLSGMIRKVDRTVEMQSL